MKFIVSSSNLLKRLSSISGVITSNPVVPILDNFLFEIKENELTVTASDLQTFFLTKVQVEAHGDSRIAIPAKILIDTLKNLPDQPITFTIDENAYNVEITSNNGRYRLACENSEDFPPHPSSNSNIDMDIENSLLKKAIGKLLFATSSDELKPSMGGIFLKMHEERMLFVATDGHKLARYTFEDLGIKEEYSCIIPRKPLSILNNISISDKDQKFNIALSKSHAYFNIGSTKMITKLIDENYPDYNNVLPLDSPYKLTVDCHTILNSLKRVSIYANKTARQIRLKMTGSELQIFTEDLDFSNEAVERLTCTYEGNDLEIGFNSRFLIEALNNIDTEEVEIHMGESNRAVLLFPKIQENNEELLLLVMPVILREETLV